MNEITKSIIHKTLESGLGKLYKNISLACIIIIFIPTITKLFTIIIDKINKNNIKDTINDMKQSLVEAIRNICIGILASSLLAILLLIYDAHEARQNVLAGTAYLMKSTSILCIDLQGIVVYDNPYLGYVMSESLHNLEAITELKASNTHSSFSDEDIHVLSRLYDLLEHVNQEIHTCASDIVYNQNMGMYEDNVNKLIKDMYEILGYREYINRLFGEELLTIKTIPYSYN